MKRIGNEQENTFLIIPLPFLGTVYVLRGGIVAILATTSDDVKQFIPIQQI